MLCVSGEAKDLILKRWMTYFDGYDELSEKIKNAKHLDDVKENLQNFEGDINYDFFWTRKYVKTIGKFQKAVFELQGSMGDIGTLDNERKLRQIQRKNPPLFPNYREAEFWKNLLTSSIGDEAYAFLGKLVQERTKKALGVLRTNLWHYHKSKALRKIALIGIDLFWGLIVFTLIAGAITNYLPWLVSLIISTIIYLLQKFLVQSYLDKKLDKRYRSDLLEQIFDLYFSRWEINALLEEHQAYLSKAKMDLRSVSDNTEKL